MARTLAWRSRSHRAGCQEADAQATAKPQYGGALEVGTVYVTLSALSWDPQDWNWKLNHDTGMYYEQLFAADLDKSVRKGGKHKFYADAWLPSDAIRGELVERWEWKENPLSVVLYLRKGVMFPDKPGVMKSRELTAEDVVFSYERLTRVRKKIPTHFDHIAKVEARDKHTVVFTFKHYKRRVGLPVRLGLLLPAIVPKEMASVDPKDWKNAVGTGPFQLVDFVQGNSQTYVKNPIYWDTDKIGGTAYKLPFVDKLAYRTIKDEATQHTALRTGKLDILEAIRWTAVDNLKKSAPQLKWSKWLNMSGTFMAMRVDQKPFTDVRVRRALNMAVNKPEIVSAYYGGNAELFAYPMHPDYHGYSSRSTRCRPPSRSSTPTTPPRPGSSWPRPGIPTASASRSRCARVRPTTWISCRSCPATSRRSASSWRSSRWSTARFSRR
jgi:peptide/nickel transport system substrate-binding protein